MKKLAFNKKLTKIEIMSLGSERIQAIIERDRFHCQFPGQHDCNNPGNLRIHHIFSPQELLTLGLDPDIAENLLTVCGNAHWDKLHRRPNSYRHWRLILIAISYQNTQLALQQGWQYPHDKDEI